METEGRPGNNNDFVETANETNGDPVAIEDEQPRFNQESRHPNEAQLLTDSTQELGHLLSNRIDHSSESQTTYAEALSEQLLFSTAQRLLAEKGIATRIDDPELEPGDRFEALRVAKLELKSAANDFYHGDPDVDKMLDRQIRPYKASSYDVMVARALLGDENTERRLIKFVLERDDYAKKAEEAKDFVPKPLAMGGFSEPPQVRHLVFSGEESLGSTAFGGPGVPETLKHILTEHLNELNLAQLAHHQDRRSVDGGATHRLFLPEKAGQRLFGLLTEKNGFKNYDGITVPADMSEDQVEEYVAAFEAYRAHFEAADNQERQKNEERRLSEVAKLEGMLAAFENKPQLDADSRTIAAQITSAEEQQSWYSRLSKETERKKNDDSYRLDNAGIFNKGKFRRQYDKSFNEWEEAIANFNNNEKRLAELKEQKMATDQKWSESHQITNRYQYGPGPIEKELKRHRETSWLPNNEPKSQPS